MQNKVYQIAHCKEKETIPFFQINLKKFEFRNKLQTISLIISIFLKKLYASMYQNDDNNE